MSDLVLWLVIGLRALIEMIVWLMLGRGVLKLLAGPAGSDNVILQFFDFLLKPPRTAMCWLFPGWSVSARERVLFALLISLWFALGVAKWVLLG